MEGRISFTLPVPEGSWMENRNGCPDIISIHVSSVDDAWISGTGKSGRHLRGGFCLQGTETMDKLAARWLLERGLITIGEVHEMGIFIEEDRIHPDAPDGYEF